jgi:diguanylate cyclase (GGDEF)-like protein
MDDRFSLTFSRLRRAIAMGLAAEALEELAAFERSVEDALSDLDSQARAVADANARAVELAEKLSGLAEELEFQNRELKEQNRAIEENRCELEQQSRAAAEANVDAVLAAEAACEQVSCLERKSSNLERTRLQLEQKAKQLEEEAAALADANAEAVAMVIETESTLEQMTSTTRRVEQERDALKDKVFVDELTGLFNHRYFREQIRFEEARARRYGRALSVVFVDLDFFKRVNDVHGHVVGDSVLRHVAEVLQAQLRASDIPIRVGRGPVLVRYGGEELVIILPETDLADAVAAAERIRAAVEMDTFPVPEVGGEIKLTLSAGVACLCSEDTEPWDLVRRADEALYRAKAEGRNRVGISGCLEPSRQDSQKQDSPKVARSASCI